MCKSSAILRGKGLVMLTVTVWPLNELVIGILVTAPLASLVVRLTVPSSVMVLSALIVTCWGWSKTVLPAPIDVWLIAVAVIVYRLLESTVPAARPWNTRTNEALYLAA